MAEFTQMVKYSNGSAGLNPQPYPTTNTDPSAGTEYSAATVSGMVFGIFMALLALYSIWQYGRQYSVLIGYLLQQNRQNTNCLGNIDVEFGTLNSMGRSWEVDLVATRDADEM